MRRSTRCVLLLHVQCVHHHHHRVQTAAHRKQGTRTKTDHRIKSFHYNFIHGIIGGLFTPSPFSIFLALLFLLLTYTYYSIQEKLLNTCSCVSDSIDHHYYCFYYYIVYSSLANETFYQQYTIIKVPQFLGSIECTISSSVYIHSNEQDGKMYILCGAYSKKVQLNLILPS